MASFFTAIGVNHFRRKVPEMITVRGLLRTATTSYRQSAKFAIPLRTPRLFVYTKRWYAQSWDNNQPNKDIDAHLKVQRLLDEIQSHPGVASKLRAVSEIMVSKGLANDSAPPGPWQVVKILTDKDVRKAMAEFKDELSKSGIELGPDQLGPLMTVLGMEKK
ncbi:LAME_0A04940g1_1 [Lachancea meyersii CBS 8951]|uniref:LAME_0A04940g1_1 n=1 Tax=Lachancea meyersii CBS 8951 TaxID=1266667 RepID=A0A1G4IPD5_9SACH|nr:LAME_0A04940g1_1 [Lachancea meyersii CBS 8951]